MNNNSFDVNEFRGSLKICILHLDLSLNYLHKWEIDEFFVTYKLMITFFTEVIGEMETNKDSLLSMNLYVDTNIFLSMFSECISAQDQKDYILLADLLELKVRPLLIELMAGVMNYSFENTRGDFVTQNLNAIKSKDKKLAEMIRECLERMQNDTDSRYVIEDTCSGYATLKVIANQNENFYYHSNNDPNMTGIYWLEKQLKESGRYHILGLGLGYEAYHLYYLTKKSIPIEVYESDLQLIALAVKYVRMDVALNDMVTIHYDPDLQLLKKALEKKDEQVLLYPPAIRNIQNPVLRKSLEKFSIVQESIRSNHILLNANYLQNEQYLETHGDEVGIVDELEDKFRNKIIYIIAAGPSLDKNIMDLKSRPPESVILATGTVLKKLMKLSIIPDYIIIIDPAEKVLGQIRGYEHCEIPLLLLSTANAKFMSKYKGKKYLIFQKDFPKAECGAERRGSKVYGTGGSVSTTALDIAISFVARKIVFLGLDLAFTNQLAHASDTSNQIAMDEKDLQLVKGWNEEQVFTNDKFGIYKEWIEKRIKEMDCDGIQFINATEGGCFVEGMVHQSLQNTLLSERETN